MYISVPLSRNHGLEAGGVIDEVLIQRVKRQTEMGREEDTKRRNSTE
jgi:hypothetical protein